MATFAIGDIQGCYDALMRLLEKLQFDAVKDTLWLTGDLVNRGNNSLGVLRYVRALGDRCRVVLGNHDLHLLAVVHGIRESYHYDTLHDVLDASDKDELMAWLIQQPLFISDDQHKIVMTHAGIAPRWSIQQAKNYAKELETALREESVNTLKHLFGNFPDQWHDDLTGHDRLRCIVNYFTRMRYCDTNGRLDFTYKGELTNCPSGLLPWFEVPNRPDTDWTILFGHWASLQGQSTVPNIHALDTGCAWGKCLTAYCLETGERVAVGCG